MKKRNISMLAGGVFALAALSACDFLDKEPLDAIGSNQFYETASATSLEQYCNYLYPRLIVGYGDNQSYSLGMIATDEMGDDFLPWGQNATSFGLRTLPTSASGTEWQWENIRTCNDFLNNYEISPESDEVKHRYAGEILFFKTLDYFNKLKTYGDVPWYDEVLGPGDEALYKARDSRILVAQNMLRDIDQAIQWLPTRASGIDVTRVTKDAALALKARFCLFEGTWRKYHELDTEGDKYLTEAYNAACELMKPEYGYSLYTGTDPNTCYHDMFVMDDQASNPEVILSRAYDPALTLGNNVTRQIFVNEDTRWGLSKNLVETYLCATTGLPVSICGCPGHTTHTTLIAELANRDPRLLQTTLTPDPDDVNIHSWNYLSGNPPQIARVIETGDPSGSTTGYPIGKFYDPTEYQSTHYVGTMDAPVYRLGEIMLIRAEAAAELGTITQTDLDETINRLRARVGFNHPLTLTVGFTDPVIEADYPNVQGSNPALIREIRRERRIEMFGEGVRYDDIRRWACPNLLTAPRLGINIYGAGYTDAQINTLIEQMGVNAEGELTPYMVRYEGLNPEPRFEDPKDYLSPIPTDEIGLNPNLKQNDGWQ